ncbi:hypothetical protein AB0M29_38885 [Streptomyces sp. NPDC051976]|uniref:hypothetical protein n=1 Tax=Streptomyces sp. NPDC051976 TaxID=3154947 RepID=UPI0034154CE6
MGARRSAATASAELEEDAPRQPAYGVPSPALLARADRGFARFLEGVAKPEDDHTSRRS